MWFKKKEKFREVSSSPATQIQEVDDIENDLIKTNLHQNLQFIKDALGTSSDIVIREILIGKEGTIKAGIIYTDGLTDTASLQNFILETLIFWI